MTGVRTPRKFLYMETTETLTATSAYGTVREVTITAKGTVHTVSGVLLGDVEGMERLGWEFSA